MVGKTGPQPGGKAKKDEQGCSIERFEGWGTRTKFPEKNTFLVCLDDLFEQSGAINFKKGSLGTWQCIGHLGMICKLPQSTTEPLHAGLGHSVCRIDEISGMVKHSGKTMKELAVQTNYANFDNMIIFCQNMPNLEIFNPPRSRTTN